METHPGVNPMIHIAVLIWINTISYKSHESFRAVELMLMCSNPMETHLERCASSQCRP